jgi:hypothetical protein
LPAIRVGCSFFPFTSWQVSDTCSAGGSHESESRDSELLHARPQCVGIDPKTAGGVALPLDLPVRFLESAQDVGTLEILEVLRQRLRGLTSLDPLHTQDVARLVLDLPLFPGHRLRFGRPATALPRQANPGARTPGRAIRLRVKRSPRRSPAGCPVGLIIRPVRHSPGESSEC